MRSLVVGAGGNMGRRYSAILKYMGEEFDGVDVFDKKPDYTEYDKIIIATPTATHVQILSDIANSRSVNSPKADVLCEKPVCSPGTVGILPEICQAANLNLYCVNQYQYLPQVQKHPKAVGITSYDYWNSGRDGLSWDCFQLFKLASGDIVLRSNSPVWTCYINGVLIDLRDMDSAYVSMLADFLSSKTLLWGMDVIKDVTLKIAKNETDKSHPNRNSSEKFFYKTSR